MVFKPSSTLKEQPTNRRFPNGDTVFRFFIVLSVLLCVWSSLFHAGSANEDNWVRTVIGQVSGWL